MDSTSARTLKIEDATRGANQPEYAAILRDLDINLTNLSDPASAIKMLERALAIYQAAYDPPHPPVAP
jgi:hypothetical protein